MKRSKGDEDNGEELGKPTEILVKCSELPTALTCFRSMEPFSNSKKYSSIDTPPGNAQEVVKVKWD